MDKKIDVYPWDCFTKNWKWAARDKDGSIHLFEYKPILNRNIWEVRKGNFRRLIPDVLVGHEKGNTEWTESLIARP